MMASIKEIKENDVDNKGLRSIDERIECPEDKPSPQVKLVPLTVGLCLAVFLLSVDRTIVAVVSRTQSSPPCLHLLNVFDR